MLRNELIDKIYSYGYEVNNRGYILKYSQKAKGLEICGQLNEAGAFFYAKNVSPFKEGQNTTREILGGTLRHYEPIVLPKLIPTIEHNFSFEDYLNTTNKKNQLGIYIKSFRKKWLDEKVKGNKYDIRGVKNGYLAGATLLPYIDKNNQFQTAKIVKYNTVSGKRSKEKYSANWFHAYKPIKEVLGIEGNVTKSHNCFFGEHLIPHNDKPIVIVEGEKTAIVLSDIYKDIVFVATGGLTQLERLDYSMMYGREVHLFPDNGANEWFEIAKYRGWNVSKVLEQDGAILGSDALDYFDSEEDLQIWGELHEELKTINYKQAEKVDYIGFNFQVKKKKSESFCLPNFKPFEVQKIVWKKSEASAGAFKEFGAFKGKHFIIYNKNFDSLSANIDFNGWVKDAEGWSEVTAEVMLKRIEALYKIVKFLNPKLKYNKIVYKLLKEIRNYSNYEFNHKHVKKNLFPLWDSEDIHDAIQPYIKNRNWKLDTDRTFKHNTSEFIKALNDDKKLAITNRYLKQIREFIREKEYINITDIIDKKRDNEFLWELVKDYNSRVLGCETVKQWNQKCLLEDYINYCRGFSACGELPPNREILRSTDITRRTIEKYNAFKEDKKFYSEMLEEVERLIDCPQCFDLERKGEGRKISIVLIPIPFEVYNLSVNLPLYDPAEAFSDKLDLSNSILNIDYKEVLRKSTSFQLDWARFKYNLSQEDMYEFYTNDIKDFILQNSRVSPKLIKEFIIGKENEVTITDSDFDIKGFKETA